MGKALVFVEAPALERQKDGLTAALQKRHGSPLLLHRFSCVSGKKFAFYKKYFIFLKWS
ncbi:hypothetical protein [Faecalispora sporosphaeroides]|uniref:hypothetical protein n=1 Tax=Faecalispora sporosphaeroides TaxID=1549 RepID=UPI00039FC103|nr:hypothetical protein [Faecalispora sporosphaeroides]